MFDSYMFIYFHWVICKGKLDTYISAGMRYCRCSKGIQTLFEASLLVSHFKPIRPWLSLPDDLGEVCKHAKGLGASLGGPYLHWLCL